MKKLRFLMPVRFAVVAAAVGAAVMLLWNWVMPVVFGLAAITFWQALGLFALARIFFGGFGFVSRAGAVRGRMHGAAGNPIREKWMGMTPEQRREFIDRRRKYGFGHHFGAGHFGEDRFGTEECDGRKDRHE